MEVVEWSLESAVRIWSRSSRESFEECRCKHYWKRVCDLRPFLITYLSQKSWRMAMLQAQNLRLWSQIRKCRFCKAWNVYALRFEIRPLRQFAHFPRLWTGSPISWVCPAMLSSQTDDLCAPQYHKVEDRRSPWTNRWHMQAGSVEFRHTNWKAVHLKCKFDVCTLMQLPELAHLLDIHSKNWIFFSAYLTIEFVDDFGAKLSTSKHLDTQHHKSCKLGLKWYILYPMPIAW